MAATDHERLLRMAEDAVTAITAEIKRLNDQRNNLIELRDDLRDAALRDRLAREEV